MYIGTTNAYRPIVEAVRREISASLPAAEVNAGANFMFCSFYRLLEKLAEREPLYQVECFQERALIDELFAQTPTPFKTLLQFYAVRLLARRHFGGAPIAGPSLDIGCGDGLTGKFVFREPIDIGADFVAADLDKAKAAGAPYRKLEVIDLQEVPYPDGHFQTVFCLNALYHVDDKRKALSELLRVTGGTLYFNDVTPEFTTHRPQLALLAGAGLDQAAREFERSTLRAQIDIEPLLAGFRVDRRPMMSLQLHAIVLAFLDLEVVFQLDGDAISEERKTRTLAVLHKVIAPLIARDAELARRGSAFVAYRVTKS